jgi:hypothetical protein
MTTQTSRFELSLRDLTVYVYDQYGECDDLTGDGRPCTTVGELRDAVAEWHRVGYYDAATRDEMLSEIP